ncbi:MAG: CopG family ribbon-helix-helix protein [Terrimicrobiaceae bacterium]
MPKLKKPREPVSRISISLPPDVSRGLDRLVEARGFENRSQAVTSIINESLLEHQKELADGIMAGTITLFYNQSRKNILGELATLKRRCIDEVIGSLQVQLENSHVMEVILVQGPVNILQKITDRLVACKGVKVGKLTLTSSIIPPLHPLNKKS